MYHEFIKNQPSDFTDLRIIKVKESFKKPFRLKNIGGQVKWLETITIFCNPRINSWVLQSDFH